MWYLIGHLFKACQPIVETIDPCEPNHQVLVEASRQAWDSEKESPDISWPSMALRKQLKRMLDVIDSWGGALKEVSATAVCWSAAAAQSASSRPFQSIQLARQCKPPCAWLLAHVWLRLTS